MGKEIERGGVDVERPLSIIQPKARDQKSGDRGLDLADLTQKSYRGPLISVRQPPVAIFD